LVSVSTNVVEVDCLTFRFLFFFPACFASFREQEGSSSGTCSGNFRRLFVFLLFFPAEGSLVGADEGPVVPRRLDENGRKLDRAFTHLSASKTRTASQNKPKCWLLWNILKHSVYGDFRVRTSMLTSVYDMSFAHLNDA
jgi:hypothetical protein